MRALVACIRTSRGDGPAHEEQLASMRKVVRLLSLAPEELEEMSLEQRAAVLSIRHATVEKMRQAKRMGSPDGSNRTSPETTSSCSNSLLPPRSAPLAMPMNHGMKRHRRPSAEAVLEAGAQAAQSAPAAFYLSAEMSGSPPSHVNCMMGDMSLATTPPAGAPMGPPSFYVRKVPTSEPHVPGAC